MRGVAGEEPFRRRPSRSVAGRMKVMIGTLNTSTLAEARSLLRHLFLTAVDAVSAERVVPTHLPAPPANGRTVVLGAGKAAAAMAAAVERRWPGPLSGLVVTRYGHAVPLERVEVVEAGHPLPDASGLTAAARMLELAAGLRGDDLVLCLFSGGGSALLPCPAPGVDLAVKLDVTRRLLRSGATIAEINCVRSHLSAIKGGWLAVACAPARVVTLVISDVPGDDPAAVASGPTVADATTFADALAVLRRYDVKAPAAIDHLRAGDRGGPGDPAETPKPGDPRLVRTETRVVARAADALAAAAQEARAAGLVPIVLGDTIEGEARGVAADHARRALDIAAGASLGASTGSLHVMLSGGETTVTVRGPGRGGRNAEYVLALAIALAGDPRVAALAADTDGIDGTEDNAGAIIDPTTLARAAAAGLDPHAALADNDAYGFFVGLGDLVVTGPTRTNVNDFRAVLITTPEAQRPSSGATASSDR